ncbi:MAG: mannose-1-phosphate guanylyltransferase [Sedimentisphaerales bacterium]|nr:mannose-1-phosphate guanylyltransferase [Sedimentisphaerales bacterium]
MEYAVIMAGGTGKRLWPLSRESRPKQVLKLLDGQTLLRRCFDRLRPIFDTRNIIVLTNARYVGIIRDNLPELPADNVIAEPAVRDTAGAIGLAATILAATDPEASMAVVTADQVIEPAELLQQALKDALRFVQDTPEIMVTFGIQPTFPSTMLGYVRCGDSIRPQGCANEIYVVDAFVEKPDEKTARKYLDSGRYLWNSGMFVWKAKTILANLERFLPDATEPLARIRADWDGPNRQAALSEWFPKLPKTSIDYAVMEKAKGVHGIKLDCRWLDLGSFAALGEIITADKNGNTVVAGASELLGCRDNIIVTEDKGHMIAAIGLENVIIAHSPDATLVCRADQADRLKELLELVAKHGGDEFL